MGPFGTLKVGNADFEVVRIRPEQGLLLLEARHRGPAELEVPRADWYAPDGSLICSFEPFAVPEEEAASARLPEIGDVTILQDLKITDVVVLPEQRSVLDRA